MQSKNKLAGLTNIPEQICMR